MKVAMLTFHKAINYGAALQAYALQTVIESLGHEVTILDYSCPYLDERKYAQKSTGLKNSLRKAGIRLLVGHDLRRKAARFHQFDDEYLHIGNACTSHTIEAVAKEFDALVVGSDQVWNMSMTGYDKSYFFDFEAGDTRKISYAASLGQDDMSDKDLADIANMLEGFNSISVREQSAATKLRGKLANKSVSLVLDPTLIMPTEKWDEFLRSAEVPDEPYVFVYSLGELGMLGAAAKRVAEEQGLRIVCQSPGPRGIVGAINVHDLGPKEFLALLSGANYVIGSSFHGVCLSVIFGRQFGYALSSSNGRNSRLVDLAEMLGVEDRQIANNKILPTEDIDYDEVYRKLELERAKSLEYLREALAAVPEQL